MKILTSPHPFLRKKAKPVNDLTKKTKKEIREMIKTLKAQTDPEGVGLAATQVGINKRIFILLLDDGPHIFINPKIIKQSKKTFYDLHPDPKDRWLEGCLSMPRIWGTVNRPFQIDLEYLTIDPNTLDDNTTQMQKLTKTFTDIESAYTQHEYDHLNGILFTDHIIKQGGEILRETPQGLTPITEPI